jgi:hypothetical protein
VELILASFSVSAGPELPNKSEPVKGLHQVHQHSESLEVNWCHGIRSKAVLQECNLFHPYSYSQAQAEKTVEVETPPVGSKGQRLNKIATGRVAIFRAASVWHASCRFSCPSKVY